MPESVVKELLLPQTDPVVQLTGQTMVKLPAPSFPRDLTLSVQETLIGAAFVLVQTVVKTTIPNVTRKDFIFFCLPFDGCGLGSLMSRQYETSRHLPARDFSLLPTGNFSRMAP